MTLGDDEQLLVCTNEGPTENEYVARVVLVGNPEPRGVDLALLEVSDPGVRRAVAARWCSG